MGSPILAFHYARDGYDTSGEKLFGRAVAGEGFLGGWHEHSGTTEAWCLADRQDDYDGFLAKIPRHLRPAARWVRTGSSADLSRAGALFVAGPNLSALAWERRCHGDAAWSLVGVTHTVAGARVFEEIGKLLVAPTQPWDAVVCTSSSVKSVLERIWAEYAEYLEARFGARPGGGVRPRLPVIPLGIQLPSFTAAEEDECRERWRERLGIAPTDVCVLSVGRLSPHAKSNPVPSCVVLNRVARLSGRRIAWVQAGWFATAAQRESYEHAMKAHASSVRCLLVDGRLSDVRREVWYAGDVFLSLVDNIQESFGLAPIEAGAHGLPVVTSDWDGFRDTIRDGVSGYRIRSTLPAAGSGGEIAMAHMTGVDGYDRYVGSVSLLTAVDIEAAVQAILRLIRSPGLRRRMGSAGREIAGTHYSWSAVVGSYVDLINELSEVRLGHAAEGGHANRHPLHLDPTDVFAGFASAAVDLPTRVEACAEAESRLGEMLQERLVGFASHLLPEIASLRAVVASVRRPVRVAELVPLCGADPALTLRGVSWLLKTGVLRESPR